ncbi:MAG: hypothetical protein V3W19_05460, partial [Desulfatiglandales bacterium]
MRPSQFISVIISYSPSRMQLLKKAKAYRIEIKWGVIWGVSSWLIVLIGFDSGSYAVTRAFNSPIGIFIALPTYIPFKLASIILP